MEAWTPPPSIPSLPALKQAKFLGSLFPSDGQEEDDSLAEGLDPAQFFAMSRVKDGKRRRRKRRRKRPGMVGSPSYGHKEVVEVKSAPRAEFLLPGERSQKDPNYSSSSEPYDAEPNCAPSGAISGFTFLNFVM